MKPLSPNSGERSLLPSSSHCKSRRWCCDAFGSSERMVTPAQADATTVSLQVVGSQESVAPVAEAACELGRRYAEVMLRLWSEASVERAR